jgi:hypothetical protein
MRLTSVTPSINKHLTIFFTLFFSLFVAIPLRNKAEKRPKEGGWGGGGKKEGEGPHFFPADRTPDIVFRSLFGFGTVEFGIAAIRSLALIKAGTHYMIESKAVPKPAVLGQPYEYPRRSL